MDNNYINNLLAQVIGTHVVLFIYILITTDTCYCMRYSWLSIGPWVKRSIVLWWQVGLVEGTGGSTR